MSKADQDFGLCALAYGGSAEGRSLLGRFRFFRATSTYQIFQISEHRLLIVGRDIKSSKPIGMRPVQTDITFLALSNSILIFE